MARILEKAPRTIAVICGNDNLAAGVIFECMARRLRVPADISVTGYNDLDIAEAIEPSITSVRTPFEPVAQAAIDYLLAKLEGKPGPEPYPTPTQIVVRDSTAAPRSPL